MADRRLVLAFAAVALLAATAGCAGALSDDPETTSTATSTTTPTATSTPTEEPVDPDNPYGERVLDVHVIYDAGADERRGSELREALDYWEGSGGEHLQYPVKFEFTEHRRAAEITVRFVPEVEQCGYTYTFDAHSNLGCAPLVDSPEKARDVEVEIENTLVPEDTTELLKHELGHALGLEHGDEPAGVMNETQVARPMEKTIPYTLSVDSSYDSREVEEQVSGVEEYVDGGSDGALVPNVSMERIDNRSEAFLHISVEDEGACDGNLTCTFDNYECSKSEMCLAFEEDGEAIETAFTVTTSNVGTEYIAYAVAYELHAAVFYPMYYIDEMPGRLTSPDTDFSGEWWG